MITPPRFFILYRRVYMNGKVNKYFMIAIVILIIICVFPVIAGLSMERDYIYEIKTVEELEAIKYGVVYFGRDACPTCAKFAPLLFMVANETRSPVYHFDTDHFRKNNICSEETLQMIFKKYNVDGVPIVISIKDGEFYRVVPIEMSDDEAELERNIREVIHST